MSSLPPELLQRILAEAPINEDGARTLGRFSMVCKAFFALARDPGLWKTFYNDRYKHFDSAQDADRRKRLEDDWSSMYYERRLQDLRALQELDELIETASSRTRLILARGIVDRGLEIYDALDATADGQTVGLIEVANEDHLLKCGLLEGEMKRRTWAYRLLCIITTRDALTKWTRLKRLDSEEEDMQVPFEVAFACLSSFHGFLGDDTLAHVYALADDFKDAVESSKSIVLDTTRPEFDMASVCTEILYFMHQEGFERGRSENFYDVENSLPHSFLFTHKHSLPISLVFVFVSIMRRLGFHATPFATGSTVIAIVSGSLFVDVYRRDVARLEVPINDIDDSQRQANNTIALLIRAARNIMSALDPQAILRNTYNERAYFAARCISMLLMPSRYYNLDHELTKLDPHFIIDQEISGWNPSYKDIMVVEKELVLYDNLTSISRPARPD